MNIANYPEKPILIVDDEEQFLLSASVILSSEGITNVLQCEDSRKVISMMRRDDVSAVMLDMSMPYVSGMEVLEMIEDEFPEVPVIIITALNEVDTAVECMKKGAFDYIVKPVDEQRMITTLKRAVELRDVRNENRLLKKYLLSDKLDHPEFFTHIITKSNAMKSIFQYVEAISQTALPVLITGETGVGKELIAQAIHNASKRKGEFVTVNVAGLDDNLFSDTLFGHRKGSFTGAERDRKGLIEQAAGGTLFLDEIGDLRMESQVKLLRLLQEKKYYPLGADVPKHTDARIVVATNKDITAMQKKGEFRKDLYYRLWAHHIHIPTLKERKEDIKLLVDHFLDKASKELRKKRPTPPKELYILLANYHFPGNIRELEGMIFDAVSRHKSGILSLDSFRDKIQFEKGIDESDEFFSNIDFLSEEDDTVIRYPSQLPTLKEAEFMLIEEAMKRAEDNQTIASEMLGLSRRALNNRLQRAKKK